MSYTVTATRTQTYTFTDIETVMRRVLGDFIMIASSTGTIPEDEARKYLHDVELLAKGGFLAAADVTLLSALGREIKATRFDFNVETGELTMSRPGGVLWPRISGASLRVVLYYTPKYTAAARLEMAGRLKFTWFSTNVDTSHAGLTASVGRDYVSNGYGVRRKDWA